MKIIYRISDSGYKKIKPYYVTKKNCFVHFISVFKGYDIYIIADNISDNTFKFLSSYIDTSKIFRTYLSNAGSFMYSINFAINNFSDNDYVYFAEDDYIYTSDAPVIIQEGLDISDYSTGYDHPDKYINHNEGGPNHYIYNGGENTRLLITKSRHWKITNSTCMTFATKVNIIKEDFDIYTKYCSGSHPYDFEMFIELVEKRKRKLISSVPAVSTHGETNWLSPFINWEKEFYNNLGSLQTINTALIVEPRFLENLPKVIEQFRKTIGILWKIVFYCGKDLMHKWKPLLHSSVEIRELYVNNFNSNTYNDFYKQKSLWENLYGDFVLIFQADTWVMNIEPYTIDYFVNLDKSFIGGNMSYHWVEFTCCGIDQPLFRNFNGGLSLRKRKDMIAVLDNFPPEMTMKTPNTYASCAEDVYYTIGCMSLGYAVGDDENSSHFALHTIFHSNFFGIHQPDTDTKNKLLSNYPEYVEIPYI